MQNLLKHAPLFTALVAAFLFLGVLYLQSLELLNAPNNTRPVPKPSALPATAEKAVKQHDISKFSLFGDPSIKKSAPKPEKNLPKTTLRLVLTGVSAGAGDSIASALIEGPDKSTLLYKAGDSLPGNATLNNIYDDRVVIKRSGRLENLFFPKVSTGGAQYLAKVEHEDNNEQSTPSARKKARTPSVDPSRKSSIKDRLDTLRQRMRNGNN